MGRRAKARAAKFSHCGVLRGWGKRQCGGHALFGLSVQSHTLRPLPPPACTRLERLWLGTLILDSSAHCRWTGRIETKKESDVPQRLERRAKGGGREGGPTLARRPKDRREGERPSPTSPCICDSAACSEAGFRKIAHLQAADGFNFFRLGGLARVDLRNSATPLPWEKPSAPPQAHQSSTAEKKHEHRRCSREVKSNRAPPSFFGSHPSPCVSTRHLVAVAV